MDIKSQYKKERRRANRLIKAYEKRGYDVEISLPKLVKKPTQKSIEKLKAITPRVVRQNAFAPDLNTGEKINYNSFKIRYSKITPNKAREIYSSGGIHVNDINILYFERIVSDYTEHVAEMVMRRLRGMIDVFGEDAVDEALGQMISDGDIVEPSDGYNYRLVSVMMEKLGDFLMMDKQEKKLLHDNIMNELDSQEYYEGEFESWL